MSKAERLNAELKNSKHWNTTFLELKSHPNIWLAVLVFSTSVLCTGGIVFKLQKNYDLAAQRELTIAVEKIASIISKDFQYRLAALQELQQQWNSTKNGLSYQKSSVFVRQFFRKFPGVHELQRIDKNAQLQWRFSEKENGDIQIDSVSRIVSIPSRTDSISIALQAALQGGKTRPLQVFLPFRKEEKAEGFLSAILLLKEWIPAIITPDDLNNYTFEIFQDGSLVYQNNSTPSIDWKKWGVTTSAQIQHLNWEFRLKPSPLYIRQLKSSVPLAVFLSGISIAFLLALLVHGVQILLLNNKRLLLYQKQLQQKNTELAQYMFAASHDLQEPLNSIIGFLNLFQEDYEERFDEQAHRYFEYIQKASKRMKAFIVGLLSYSEVGKNHQNPEGIKLSNLLEEVLEDLQGSIQQKQAKIKVAPMPEVIGFRLELKQLFQNLISNAIKYHKKNVPPKIEIKVEKQNTDWCFCVKDNGIGIDEKFNEQIFKIFQRLHKKNVYQGAGIGLSISKKIVELHHGKIWVESKPGQGSSFYFTIPRRKLSSRKISVQEQAILNSNVPDYSASF